MSNSKYIWHIIFLTLMLLGSLAAETIELDLETAREIALENNPEVKKAREVVKKATAQITETRAGFLPTLNGFTSLQHAWELQRNKIPNFLKPSLDPIYQALYNAGYMPSYQEMPDYLEMSFGLENTLVYGVNLQQPIYTGGAVWNGYQISQLGSDIAESQLETTIQNILNNVTGAYYSALFAKSAVEVTEQALNSAQKNLDQVTKFYETGKSSRLDVLRAEVQVANFKPQLISAKNQLRLAKSNLANLLGIAENSEFKFKDELTYRESDLMHSSLGELTQIALQNRAEITMIESQKAIAERQVAINRSTMLPKVSFSTSYQYQGMREDLEFTGDDLNKSFNSSLSISIPLFNGFKNSAKLQQAKIGIKEVTHQQEALRNGIRLEVKSAYYKMKEAEEKVQTQAKTIEQAQEALRLANLMYAEGASTQLDVLNANLAVKQAKMNYQQSLLEYNLALSGLKKAINQL